jgi:hypothetical protein
MELYLKLCYSLLFYSYKYCLCIFSATPLTGRKNRFAINLHTCKLVANSISNIAINLRMKCFRFATTKFTSNLQAALHNLQIYM